MHCVLCGAIDTNCYSGHIEPGLRDLFIADIYCILANEHPPARWRYVAENMPGNATVMDLKREILAQMCSYLIDTVHPTLCIRILTLLYTGVNWTELEPRLQGPAHIFTACIVLYAAHCVISDEADPIWLALQPVQREQLQYHYTMITLADYCKKLKLTFV